MISLASVEKICKKATNARITKTAVEYLRDECMNELRKITKNSLKLAKHAGRITIREEDLRFFYKNFTGKTNFHKNSIEKAMKSFGAQRIGRGTAELAGLVIEQQLINIARKAFNFAQHAKRKSINDIDVKLALSNDCN